jgi:diaminohydroxyphosphoribosylaminopyrimidine deaminase/5-amino-6-(5-phosphoribosylamino)uracil reductase
MSELMMFLSLFSLEMTDEQYMIRCLELAEQGRANVAPNPMVGCVIVHNGKIIGEGYHEQFGEAHAEVNAIRNVEDKSLLRKSTLFVNLEPCSHFGKTPPCADLIIQHKIPRVVIGGLDMHSKVNGQGIKKLILSGCDVKVGFAEEECLELNKRFFTFHSKKRPYVILKWAQTSDGFMDKKRDVNETGINWISTTETKTIVHQWRAEESAILVGRKTIETDNPSLTVREVEGKNPLRVVLDPENNLNGEFFVFSGETKSLIYTKTHTSEEDNCEWKNLDEYSLESILTDLHSRNINSLIVEGGRETLRKFIDLNLWDEARIITGVATFKEGLEAPIIHGKSLSSTQSSSDKIDILKNLI